MRLIFGIILFVVTVTSYPILESYAELVDIPVELLLAIVVIPSIIVLSNLID